jgi:hypothetical protein
MSCGVMYARRCCATWGSDIPHENTARVLLSIAFSVWVSVVSFFVKHPTYFCVRYWGAAFLSGVCSFTATTVVVLTTFNVVV